MIELFLDFLALLAGLYIGLETRFSLCSTGGKWVWAIALQFEECGCKHIDCVLGLFFIRWDFGRHRK
jgi:hypothetical protein